jgi:serine/threonine protein phosphatase PrpC
MNNLMQTTGTGVRVESYGATRPQQGRTQNEDAFLIGRAERPFAALADGAGNAERAAKRVLTLFEKLLSEGTTEQIAQPETWARWVKLLDSSLLGSTQSTFLAVAFTGNEATGVCVGDSRAYLINRDGQCKIVTDGAAKHRLGSGQAQPFPLRLTLGAGDILLLLSDGAWTPLSLYALQKCVVTAALKHFSEMPGAILDAAEKTGRADDMTVVVLRLLR